MKYNVGQVLYVVLKKETRVYPMQVVEEITKKTLDGVLTSYMVRGGTDPKAQLLITEVDGEIFDSAEKAKLVLIERATMSIARLVDAACTKAREWYPNSFEAPGDDPIALLKKASAPTVKQPPSKQPSNVVAELAQELLADSDEIADKSTPVITLPDGTQAKVRSIRLQ